MYINNAFPAYFSPFSPAPQIPPANAPLSPVIPKQAEAQYYPGVILDISPEGWAAYARSKETKNDSGGMAVPTDNSTQNTLAAGATEGCQTCKNRRYKDVSNDPSVSYQAPTRISPGQAATAVMSHEREHVSHEQARADREGRRVISQTVTLRTAACPECGRIYVSGGTTRTVTAKDNSGEIPPQEIDVYA